MEATVQKWSASVPGHFRFTFKLWKEITHVKGLAFNPKDVNHFMQVIANADNKKGCLLVQFPPSLKIVNMGQLEKLLIAIQDTNLGQNWKVALEFRDKS